MTMTTSTTRRPRFERTEIRTHLQLTDRDLDIMAHVGRSRFLRSTDIAKLVAGTEKKVIERLGQLFYAGYLDRVDETQYYRPGAGSARIVYALTDQGARALIDQKRMPPVQRLAFARKNQEATKPHIKHTLAVADFTVRLTTGCRRRSDITLQLRDELLATMPEQTRTSGAPFKWTVPVMHQGELVKIGINPDLEFALAYTDGTRRCFLVERDRGSMPIARERLDQTSILKKLLGYDSGRKQDLHKTQFNWRNFRVLFIAETPQRADNIIHTIARHDQLKQSPLFLVTDKKALDQGLDIFLHQWRTPTKLTTLLGK